MDVKYGFEEVNTGLLLLGIIVVLLELKCGEKALLEFIEHSDRYDEGWYFLFLLRDIIIRVVHVPKHLECGRAHWIVKVQKAIFVGS